METFKLLIIILLSAVFVDNYVLSRFLGICPFLGVSKKIDQAAGMGHNRTRRHQQRVLRMPVHIEEIAHDQQPDPLRLLGQGKIDGCHDREKDQKLK